MEVFRTPYSRNLSLSQIVFSVFLLKLWKSDWNKLFFFTVIHVLYFYSFHILLIMFTYIILMFCPKDCNQSIWCLRNSVRHLLGEFQNYRIKYQWNWFNASDVFALSDLFRYEVPSDKSFAIFQCNFKWIV